MKPTLMDIDEFEKGLDDLLAKNENYNCHRISLQSYKAARLHFLR